MDDCTKTAYTTRSEADAAVRNIRRSAPRFAREERPLRSYRCDECGLWHTTSKRSVRPADGARVRRRSEAAMEILDEIREQYDGPIPRFKM